MFDIQQGVAICLLVKRQAQSSGATEIRHADLWGQRAAKYAWLAAHDVSEMPWRTLMPKAPRRLFVPQDEGLLAEYESGWSIIEAMRLNGDPAPGIVTTHDGFAISWTREEAIAKVERFLATANEEEARAIWRLLDNPVELRACQTRTREWRMAGTSDPHPLSSFRCALDRLRPKRSRAPPREGHESLAQGQPCAYYRAF